MKIALVTTWETACGIAEHSALLVEAVLQADPSMAFVPMTDLNPTAFLTQDPGSPVHGIDLVWLNYQAALHSQWTPERIRQVREYRRVPIGVTYHDTGVPNSEQCQGICAAADAAVVHEPFDDLDGAVQYWRMGVPSWPGAWQYDESPRGWSDGRPILGSIGFPFPWKNYDELARVTRAQGWALLLIAPTASAADVRRWEALNPHTKIVTEFLNRRIAVGMLAGCDATAFCYTCANTGQSGAVLQGIAARKPVIAFPSCRQFRALYLDPLGRQTLAWCDSFAMVELILRAVPIERVDPGMVALAEQDSWSRLGQKYADLFRSLVPV